MSVFLSLMNTTTRSPESIIETIERIHASHKEDNVLQYWPLNNTPQECHDMIDACFRLSPDICSQYEFCYAEDLEGGGYTLYYVGRNSSRGGRVYRDIERTDIIYPLRQFGTVDLQSDDSTDIDSSTDDIDSVSSPNRDPCFDPGYGGDDWCIYDWDTAKHMNLTEKW